MAQEKPNYAKIKMTRQKPPVPLSIYFGAFGRYMWKPVPRSPLLDAPDFDDNQTLRNSK